jgi:glycosyltransferase involved in cell wall biosynthesis
MQGIRVAQVVSTGRFAGMARVACELAQGLAGVVERSVLYLVLQERAGRQTNAALLEAVESFDVERRVFALQDASRPLASRLREVCREDGVHLAHHHSPRSAILVGPFKKRYGVAASVFTIHKPQFSLVGPHGRSSLRHLVGAYLSDAVIACSRPLARTYARFPLLGGKTTTIVNGIRIESGPPREEARARLAERFHLNPDAVWVGTVGRQEAQKNLALMLRAMGALRKRRPDVPLQLLLVGDGQEREALGRLAATLGLDDVVAFTGQLGDVASVYAALDVFALTSTHEGTPMVILEAMSHGLAVAASAVGGIPDVVGHETSGLLFPSGDLAAAAEVLERLVADADLRRTIGERARERVTSEFGLEAWTEKHLDLYRRLLAHSR